MDAINSSSSHGNITFETILRVCIHPVIEECFASQAAIKPIQLKGPWIFHGPLVFLSLAGPDQNYASSEHSRLMIARS
jgi:hypothetical protein